MTTQTTMPPEPPTAEPRASGTAGGSASMPAGPGAQLRQARLDLKLAPEDVANILHLSSRQIVTLENDDYEHLPGPTYVRGYLRGYAQLLGLSAEPIVEAYNRLVAARKPVDLGKLAPKPEMRSDHQLVKFATVGVVALILGLSAVWWQEQDEPAPVVTNESVPQPAETEELTEAAVPSVDTASPVETPAVQPPAVVGGGAPTKPAGAMLTPANTEPAAIAVAPAPVVPVVTGPRGRVVIQTTLDSWADVRDANGNRLLYRIVPAGNTEAIEGVAPLSVFLGNAEGVRVEYNGEVLDIARYRRGDIARFTLGEPARTP